MVLEAEEESDRVSDNPRHPDPARARDFTHFKFQFKATPTQRNATQRASQHTRHTHTPQNLQLIERNGEKKRKRTNEEYETRRGIRKEKSQKMQKRMPKKKEKKKEERKKKTCVAKKRFRKKSARKLWYAPASRHQD